MSKANFYRNNIDNSKSLAVKIQNSTNIPKGALIRVLPPSKYQTSESRYFTDTHLKYVYEFYKQNGYEQYSSFSDFLSDLEKQNPDCIIKTFLTVYKGLKECCDWYNKREKFWQTKTENIFQLNTIIPYLLIKLNISFIRGGIQLEGMEYVC